MCKVLAHRDTPLYVHTTDRLLTIVLWLKLPIYKLLLYCRVRQLCTRAVNALDPVLARHAGRVRSLQDRRLPENRQSECRESESRRRRRPDAQMKAHIAQTPCAAQNPRENRGNVIACFPRRPTLVLQHQPLCPQNHPVSTRGALFAHFFGARGSLTPSAFSIFAITALFGIALPCSYS